ARELLAHLSLGFSPYGCTGTPIISFTLTHGYQRVLVVGSISLASILLPSFTRRNSLIRYFRRGISTPVVALPALLSSILLAPADAGPNDHLSAAAGAGVGLAWLRLPV